MSIQKLCRQHDCAGTQRGRWTARADIRTRIRRYNESTGTANSDTGGYHETLTRLYVLGIQRFLRDRAATEPTLPLLTELLRSELADTAWPLRFYRRETLFSVEARRGWLEPDLHDQGAGDPL